MEEDTKPALPKPELFKPEDTNLEKSAFLPTPKPLAMPHPPKISPSSIPNPSPSVSTNKPVETGFPNYGGYLYSIPGYSAFQPVSFPSIVQPHPGPVQAEPPKPDFVLFPPKIVKEPVADEQKLVINEVKATASKQQDFEDHFIPEIVPASSNTEAHTQTQTESKMSITSLTQGSGATVTIPNQANKETKKKSERFSLKTSIPISKIDMKCVNNSVDTFQNSIKKSVFNPAFPKENTERPKVEIQSNIVIKTASKQADVKEKLNLTTQNNSISTLINAAEAISKSDNQFRMSEPKTDIVTQSPEAMKSSSPQPLSAVVQRPMFNPVNLEKPNFPLKPPEGGYNEQKNQIVYIQNKTVTNPKMVVTLQNPQNPQVLLQRTNIDSKNLQIPSRLSSQKKSKEDVASDNGSSSKVVALKRLHQDNCDENDFENLITENQIYGNKIVVKEKSQGTQQEQDLKVKNKDKQIQPEPKSIVLQPSYVYVSNVQFPANLMMIKTNSKTCQTTDCYKTKVSPNENKSAEVITTVINNCNTIDTNKNCKPEIVSSKDIHILKSSNVLQTLSNNKNNKSELVIATNQKLIMSPQMAYQVITDSDNKNQSRKEIPKVMTPKKELPKLIEMNRTEKKMIITCQYKVDSKLHPKLVIANIKPKIATKVEVISTLDIYARRKRLRRLKYLSNNNNKEIAKIESRKIQERTVITGTRNIITPEKMRAEIFKEFANTKDKFKAANDESDSDYGEEELLEYNSIIEEYGPSNRKDKLEFLAGLRLVTHDAYREKDLEKQDRNLKHDSVATAYIAAGVLDQTSEKCDLPAEDWTRPEPMEADSEATMRRKQKFLSQLRLQHVTQQFKEAYEKIWQEVLKERRRRKGFTDPKAQLTPTFDPNNQLKLLTEIKNCVNINNNLIKKRLDSSEDTNDITILAEKNFSELNRLSKMADRSVKLFSGQNTRKRDLNPGFDSENIQKLNCKIEPFKEYPKLIIPSISKIVSLKTAQECVVASSTQATSMDEPSNCAAGASSISQEMALEKTSDFGCQVGDGISWPGVDAFVRSYKEYEIARKKEMASLHRRNTSLCVESAHVTRAASRHSDRARALLAERRHLAVEESNLRGSLQRLCSAIDVIRKS